MLAQVQVRSAPYGARINAELNQVPGPKRDLLSLWPWRGACKNLPLKAIRFLCAASLLVGMLPLAAQSREFRIYKNRSVVLKSDELSEVTSSPADVSLYRVLVQKMPYIEIHLEQAVPADNIGKGPLRARCAEVGIFKDRISRQTWTIGKGCRLF